MEQATTSRRDEAGGLGAALHNASGRALAIWSVIATIAGLLADFAEPLAPVATNLLALSIIVLLLCAVAMFVRPLRKPAGVGAAFSGVATLIFGFIVFGQEVIAPPGEGEQRGLAASYVQPLAGLQAAILPISEDKQAMLEFASAISDGSDTMRAVAARDLIARTEDPLLRRGMIETLYDAGRPPLRQMAIALAFAEREGDRLALVPRSDGEFAQSLIGHQFTVRAVDTASGALDLGSHGQRVNGTVGREAVTLSLFYSAPGVGRQTLEVRLNAQDDYELVGTARLASGEAAEIALPLL